MGELTLVLAVWSEVAEMLWCCVVKLSERRGQEILFAVEGRK